MNAPKKQKRYYSGKQRCHTLKAQLLVEYDTGQVVCTAIDTGKTHDFKRLKRRRLPFVASQLCLADRGYQGFAFLECPSAIASSWGLHADQETPQAALSQSRKAT